MGYRPPDPKDTLTGHVLQRLADRIEHGVYPPGGQLPPENQLAAEFDVSRATIRRALDRLSERDLIIRKQGDGTYVSNLPCLTNPLNQFIDIRRRIAAHGFEADFTLLSVESEPASNQVAKLLHIMPGSDILRVRKVFTADGTPIIYVINHIPLWVYQDHLTPDDMAQPDFAEPFFDFFKIKCKQPVKYYVSSIRPELAGHVDLPDSMALDDPCTPILILDDVGYDYMEKPVFYSIEHISTISIDIQIVRRVDIT